MKVETIEEIGKRMGKQKGKSFSLFNCCKGSQNGGLLKMLLSGRKKKER